MPIDPTHPRDPSAPLCPPDITRLPKLAHHPMALRRKD